MVIGHVAVTDTDWLSFLAHRQDVDEVNFWSPSGSIIRCPVGTPWFFKAKAPTNAIAGGGFFAHSTQMPLYLAWEAFRDKNGVATLDELERKILRYRGSTLGGTPVGRSLLIGCNVLTQPFFLDPSEYVDLPSDFARQIVRYKQYDLTVNPGLQLWSDVQDRLAARSFSHLPGGREMSPMLGKPRLVTPRLGQGAFRLTVIDAYERRCAVTGERTLPALEAAHIRPFSDVQRHEVVNGIALRSDIHRLFDQGYVTIDADRRFRVSRAIRDEFENGRDYYALHKSRVREPQDERNRPNPESLIWHATELYRGD